MTHTKLLIACVSGFMLASPARAQDSSLPTVALNAQAFTAGQIEPGQRSVSRPLTIDAARSFSLLIAAAAQVRIGLKLPDGTTLDPRRADGDRISWRTLPSRGDTLPEVMPGLGTGFNTLVTIKSPQAGAYELALARTRDDGRPIPFVATLVLDSDLRMGLWLQSARALLGAPITIAAILLDGEQPVHEAGVMVNLLRDPADGVSRADSLGELPLRDGGDQGDMTAGDGVFSAQLTPSAAGPLRLALRATGRASGGAFERQSGALLLVTEPSVKLRNTAESGQFRDLGRRGLVVPLEVAGTAGRYDVVATLRATNGAAVSEHQLVTLDGTARVDIVFGPERFALSRVKRPLTLESIDAYELTKDDRILRGRLVGGRKRPLVRPTRPE
jgi:hypothetical protein